MTATASTSTTAPAGHQPRDAASVPFTARHIGPRPADAEHMLQTPVSYTHLTLPTKA